MSFGLEKKVDVEKRFIIRGLRRMEINEYLRRVLSRAGYVKVDLMRTPLGTRVVIHAERPFMVIGRRGSNVKQLAKILQSKFGLDNPQIEVIEIPSPYLNAKIVAYHIANALARGVKFRRAAFIALRRIMEAGARGAEIVISGKLTSERARYEKYSRGVIYKVGQLRKVYVDEAVVEVLLKPGMYGIEVRIMPPVETPEDIKIKEPTE
ncbi:MAG: 30S ribosomal protein S3 [Thermoprotei archaeon]|nr:MAG: 30S ribosomal protein S3 [Thermoprotei archaeon]RLF01074.1 MAG: 30S ribosomal protein S3 [Thermoprotei archaeon]